MYVYLATMLEDLTWSEWKSMNNRQMNQTRLYFKTF